jgi:large subunit ribosomal protein L5
VSEGEATPKASTPKAPKPKAAEKPARQFRRKPPEAPQAPAVAAAPPGGLRRRYLDEVAPAMRREFGYANPMQIPRLEKVIVNIGLGEAIQNAKALDAAVGDLTQITGQKPIITKAKRSIAQFRLRTGMPIGAKVTLRGQRMYDFLERTMRLGLPRIRDFRGISRNSFDGRGNFSLGLREQLVYPEIDYDKIDRLRGMEISIVTTAKTDEEGLKLLQLLGMPFQAS